MSHSVSSHQPTNSQKYSNLIKHTRQTAIERAGTQKKAQVENNYGFTRGASYYGGKNE